MRRISALLIALILVVSLAGIASAASDPAIQARITEQQKRIDEGIASGKLARTEADIVQDNLNWIKSEEAKFMADGKLSRRERAKLNKWLDHNSNMIYKKKHNRIKRLY